MSTRSHTSTLASATDCTQHWEDPAHLAANKDAFRQFRLAASTPAPMHDHGPVPAHLKRGRGANQLPLTESYDQPPQNEQSSYDCVRAGDSQPPQSKKQKSHHCVRAGDKARVPPVGHRVFFDPDQSAHAHVVGVLYHNQKIGGTVVHATKEDPMVLLAGDVVRRPEELFF